MKIFLFIISLVFFFIPRPHYLKTQEVIMHTRELPVFFFFCFNLKKKLNDCVRCLNEFDAVCSFNRVKKYLN